MPPYTSPLKLGPSFRDWTLLALGIGFVVMGLVIVPSNHDVGIVTIAFFGACSLTFASTVLRKLRYSRHRTLHAEVVGGIPIRPSRTRILGLGLSVFFLGAILVLFGQRSGVVMWYIAWLIALAGALVLFGLATRRIPTGFIQFDPEGITIGQKHFAYQIPFASIVRVASWELHDNPALGIWVTHNDAVIAIPPECQAKVLKHLATNEHWLGAPVALMMTHYELDLPPLICALERYIADPSARSELGRKKLGRK